MSERRAGAKGRRLGSSRRKQLQEGPGQAPAPAPSHGEEPPWASEVVQRVQHLLSHRDTEQAAVVTRSDMQKLQEEGLPCSREELELVFDGLDAAGTGRLGTEEFTAGLRQFLSSQNAAREHRRRKTASRRVRLVLPRAAMERGDSEERRHFAAFMEQLGTGNPSEEQEIWQLWVKLRQDEPQLLDNLEGFLAKMRHRIQEARSEKEALELTLNKRVAEHDKDVQQLCEVLERQIQQEQLRLQQQSTARSQQQGEELQRVLDASEREVQRLVTAQMELERRCHSLHSSQQVTSTENQQLQESNQALQQHLQHLHQQLQQTQGHLRTMRATVAWEHMGEPGDRVVAELPIEVPMSPQLSPGKSEKFRSEMRIRLGSQSSESKAKSTHQVVWEMLPAETNLSGAPRKASSAEEDPFPEPLKEEGVSDQSSLLREMNDAIAALSKHLKAQALGAPPALADTACHPWDNAEAHTGPEAATAHETTPGVLQETLPGHIHHELLEGDLQEGPATAELRAPDVTQAGASAGAGHCMAQESGAEQGESPEEAQRMLFQQGKGAGVEEMVLNVAEHLGESMEAGEQVLLEVEGAEWLQETTAWAKPQLLGEAEEGEINQRKNLEASLGPPEAGQEGVAVGQCLAMDEQQPGRTMGECVQAPGTALQERAEPASGLPGKLETELGEQLEPEPPSWREAQVGAAHGGGVPEVTVAPGPGVPDEERARTEVQPQGETTDSKVLEVLPARAERAGSGRAGGEEEEVEEAEPREAEQQLQGECAREGAGWRGRVGVLEPLAVAVPPTRGQRGGGTDVELMEAPSSTNVELLTEVEADLQVWNEDGSPGTQRGGSMAPGVQLEKDNPEAGLGEELGAAAVHSEGPSPAGTPVGSPDLCGLFPGTSQALVEAQLQLSGGLSPENAQGGKGERAVQLQENEEEDGAQGQGEHGLPHEPVPQFSGVILGQGEGAGAPLQPGENDESLDTVEDQSSGANVQLIAEGDELRLTPGGSTEADLQPWGEAGCSGTEQGGSVDPEVQPLDQVNTEDILEMEVEDVQEDVMELLAEVEADVQVWNEAGPSGTEHGGSVDSEVHPLDEGNKAELVEGEAEDAQADLQLSEGLSSGVPRGEETGTNAQMEEKDNEAQGQGEYELPHEPVLDLHGSGVRQGEGAGEDMQAQEEAESLDTVEDQSSDANVQLIAEGDELRLTPGGRTEADLQLMGEAGCSGTEQGGSVAPEVQPLDQGDKAELVEEEAEDAQTLQLSEARSSGVPRGGEIETNAQMEEEEDGAQRLGEYELPHEPELDLHGSGVRQGEGAGEDMQAQEEAESLHTTEAQSSGANVQLIAEGGELKSASGESREADLQPLIQTDSMATEQGGSVDPEVQPLDQGEEAEVVERKAEHSWTDTQLCVTASPETPQGGEHCAALQPRDGDGDWGQGQGGRGQMQELVPDPSGVTIRQRRGTEAGVQPVEEAESLDTVEDQSSGANVQLIAEGDELRLSPGGSTEADLQPWGEAGSSGIGQGGSVDPEVHSLDQEKKEDILERKAEDAQEDMMFHEGPSPGGPWRGEGERAVQLEEEEEDGAQGQGEGELPHEPELDLHGSGVRQGEGAGEDMQAQEEAESLHTTEAQSSGANVQLIAEGGELRLTPGGSTEADLQPWGEAGSSGIGQGGSVDPEVHSLDQVNTEDILEMQVVDAQADLQLCVGPSSETLWGRERGIAVQIEEEEDGAQGQGEHGLPHEPVPHPSGVILGQGEGAGARLQPGENDESLDTVEDQSSGANVQLIAEGGELRLTPGGRTEADLQPWGEAGSSGREQGGRLDPEVQPLDQGDKAELVGGEAEDAQGDLQLSEGLSSGAPWGEEWRRALQNEEEEEGGAQVQGENRLPQEPVLAPEGAGGQQGEGAGAGAQTQDEAVRLHTLEAKSTDADVQLFTDQQMPKSGSGGSMEADLTPLGVAGLWEGEQSLTLGLEAVLGASPTAKPWEGAAAADVPPPAEAAVCPEPMTAAESSGLEAKLGACIGPEGQILEAQELLQGEGAAAEERALDGAHGLELAQGERLEAGVRDGVKTQGLGLNQGHDDAELASLVSEVLSQLSPLKLETMMQEDVLIPDVWRLCAPGQAAQRELQEQVSAQGHEGRLHTVAQHPEGETPPARELENTAAGPAEHPKQEVPPASTLHKAVPPGDAGSDQLGGVLRENSLGQRQLLGEQSKDLSVGQREKMQEFGQKMSQEGEPSSGEPGAVTAGAAPQGCPKAALDPDHLYNVLFVGDSHVGKTSFLYRLHADTFNPHLTATVGLDYQIKNLVVDNKRFALRLWDSAGQERYRSMTKQFFRKADGVVLMYDITSEYSFSDVRYWLSCIQEGAEDGVAVLLLGNKTDCAAQRQVPTKEGECLAKEHQLMFFECSAASGHNVFESMVSFTRLLKVREDELKNKAAEVPKVPEKKKSCCW